MLPTQLIIVLLTYFMRAQVGWFLACDNRWIDLGNQSRATVGGPHSYTPFISLDPSRTPPLFISGPRICRADVSLPYRTYDCFHLNPKGDWVQDTKPSKPLGVCNLSKSHAKWCPWLSGKSLLWRLYKRKLGFGGFGEDKHDILWVNSWRLVFTSIEPEQSSVMPDTAFLYKRLATTSEWLTNTTLNTHYIMNWTIVHLRKSATHTIPWIDDQMRAGPSAPVLNCRISRH